MDAAPPPLLRYTELLMRHALSRDELVREQALIDATELAKGCLAEGPAIDQMHDLHLQAQSAVAEAWRDAPEGSAEREGRESLVRGDAIQLLLALTLPHELAQRAHHEKRWRREHETLVAMFEQTEEIIVVLDLDGQCDDVNPAFCRATGWTRRQAVEGAAAWADLPGPAAAQRLCTAQACADGRVLTLEWSVSPILGSKGELLSHVCIGRDLGRQKQIEDSLRENDKLRAVATLAGGIAHDFNNLLGSIDGLSELCELEAVAGSRQARNLARIRQAGDKAAALVRQMLDFSRQTAPTLERVLVAGWLWEMETLLRAALPRHQSLTVRVSTDATVCIDRVRMEQVLLNMLRNASQAMGGGGGDVQVLVDLAEPVRTANAAAHGHVRLRVIDQAGGIAPEVLHKIFEPFFTTKPVGEGTGLGLAAVHGIVTSHGGVIEVDTVWGTGTTFAVFLPRMAGSEAP